MKALRTPLIPLRSDAGLLLKPENLQPFGSYKIRGVLSAIAHAAPERLRQGLSAASAGNMGQTVAFVAQQLNVPCRIFVPDSAPQMKKDAIRQLGAKLIELPFTKLWKMVNGTGSTPTEGLFFHPVQTAGLLEGYGLLADEILAEAPHVKAIIIPFGVGGLTLGLSRVLRRKSSAIQIYAVEPETAAPYAASVRAGRPSRVERRPSFIDAIGTPEVLPSVFHELRELRVQSLTVPLEDARKATREIYQNHRMIVEGAGAASLAAAQTFRQTRGDAEVVAVLTGGNIDHGILQEILDSSLFRPSGTAFQIAHRPPPRP